jgi:hypothetical protein
MSLPLEATVTLCREMGINFYIVFTRDHWTTVSYAKHKTLDAYREIIHDDIDAIMEASSTFNEVEMDLSLAEGKDAKQLTVHYLPLLKEHVKKADIVVKNLVESLITHLSRFLYLYELQ